MLNIDPGAGLKVLVLYYSFSGKTRAVAQALREKTCGVLYGIETCARHDGPAAENAADREMGALPALKYALPPMFPYDLVLVGGPVWRGTVSAPLRAFLGGIDFAGKPVAAFCTHAGEQGGYFAAFRNLAGNARLVAGLDLCFAGCEAREADFGRTLDGWLAAMGLGRTGLTPGDEWARFEPGRPRGRQ